MLGKAIVHCMSDWINVAKENGVAHLWFDVHTAVSEIRVTTSVCDGAIHDDSCHARARLVLKAGTVAVAMRGVSLWNYQTIRMIVSELHFHSSSASRTRTLSITHIGLSIVEASSFVLNRH